MTRAAPRKQSASRGRKAAPSPAKAPSDEGNGQHKRPPRIVGIGASAGGLAPLVELMSHLAGDSGLSYVIVQHLDPAHESALSEILSRAGSIPVISAEDGVRLEADHAYVIPPNRSMTVTDGHLRVVQAEKRRGAHTVIDGFFQSLAHVHKDEAVGVILSGAGSDGSRGVEAIKERGGITLAQDPHTAQFPSMPENAIGTGCVDFVLAPEQIADQLSRIARHLASQPVGESEPSDDAEIEKILLMLRGHTGADFRSYRRPMVHRRILRRMLAHRKTSHAEYIQHLRSKPDDLGELYEDLLIGVTRFFRDKDAFAALHDSAFPEMMRERDQNAPIRVWVAGCSSGEEAYSIAITLLEFIERSSATDTTISIFATDLSEVAIARARAGLYPASIEADVSAERLSRFFTKEDAGYRVTRRVRDLCVFANQNIVRDPPFSRVDLISCRNVLIYFEPALQQRVMPMFNYALNPNGLLFLGAAESIGASTEYFAPFDKRHRIFRPRLTARRVMEVERTTDVFPAPRAALARQQLPERAPPEAVRSDADRAVLAHVGPPGLVINERLEITQFRGDTSAFVRHTSGTASLHLFKLVRAEFLPRLRAAIGAARGSQSVVREEQIALRDDQDVRQVSLEVVPFRSGEARDQFFVVLFDATESPKLALTPAVKPARNGKRTVISGTAETAHEIELAALRKELVDAKRFLQDVIEQYEGANEELRAANEEIQSSNEELQSTGEELETTKEEVQSTNEELTTVNDELRHRNRELAAASADLSNVFASTEIPILIVDAELVVRRFTPVAERVVKIIPTDVGRPLGDLRLRVAMDDLEERVAAVIDTLEDGQVDVRDVEGRWWSLTIRPYLTVNHTVDGAVLVFTDIDASKRYGQQAEVTSENRRVLLVEAESARAEAFAANAAKTSFLASMSHDLRTPLNAISGYADILELLVHGSLTPKQEHDVARIKRSARYLLSLINDILNFAKVESGTLLLEIEDVVIEDAVTSLEVMIEPLLRAKGLSFEHEHCEGTVRSDPEKLQQVLINLATNAIKFTRAGGVTVGSVCTAEAVTITVSDTGVGIQEDQLERIFEPFIQVSRSLTNVNHEGVGLGLAISRDLARAMGGNLTVRSTFGVGTTFSLSLPRAVPSLQGEGDSSEGRAKEGKRGVPRGA